MNLSRYNTVSPPTMIEVEPSLPGHTNIPDVLVLHPRFFFPARFSRYRSQPLWRKRAHCHVNTERQHHGSRTDRTSSRRFFRTPVRCSCPRHFSRHLFLLFPDTRR